jgi:cytochrome c553
MTRLVVFTILLCALVGVLSLRHYSIITTPNNDFFNFPQAEKEHLEFQAKKLQALETSQNHPTSVNAEDVVLEKEVFTVKLDTPELQRGFLVYTKSGKCVTCHGQEGEGKKSQQAPRIGGQLEAYLLTQLTNMKSEVRYNKQMNPYLKNLNEQDFKDVSLYLSKFPWP